MRHAKPAVWEQLQLEAGEGRFAPPRTIASAKLETSASDEALMAELKAGNLEALGVLYARYGRLVYSLASRYGQLTARADVEDLGQEMFLAIAASAHRYKETGSVRGWLCGVVIRKARESRRRSWLHRTLLGRFFTEPKPQSAEPQKASDARFELARALASLPSAMREVLELHLFDGLSAADIASTLGISENTVWTRLHRARERLHLDAAEDEQGAAR